MAIILAVLWHGPASALDILLPPVIGTTELYAPDPLTGTALRGLDPVSCLFGRPEPGQARLELRWAGLVWLFASEANRAAFAQDPDSFTPAFGGYDPTLVADGIAAVGDPQMGLVRDGRLYLFRDAAARKRFTAEIKAAAEARWPAIRAGLVGG